MNAHHEQRTDEELRALLERAAVRGAEIALQRFGDLVPQDMTTKEGRQQLSAVVNHATTLYVACESMKKEGWRTVRAGFWWLVSLSILFGFLYMLGIDPAKLKWLNGK